MNERKSRGRERNELLYTCQKLGIRTDGGGVWVGIFIMTTFVDMFHVWTPNFSVLVYESALHSWDFAIIRIRVG